MFNLHQFTARGEDGERVTEENIELEIGHLADAHTCKHLRQRWPLCLVKGTVEVDVD